MNPLLPPPVPPPVPPPTPAGARSVTRAVPLAIPVDDLQFTQRNRHPRKSKRGLTVPIACILAVAGVGALIAFTWRRQPEANDFRPASRAQQVDRQTIAARESLAGLPHEQRELRGALVRIIPIAFGQKRYRISQDQLFEVIKAVEGHEPVKQNDERGFIQIESDHCTACLNVQYFRAAVRKCNFVIGWDAAGARDAVLYPQAVAYGATGDDRAFAWAEDAVKTAMTERRSVTRSFGRTAVSVNFLAALGCITVECEPAEKAEAEMLAQDAQILSALDVYQGMGFAIPERAIPVTVQDKPYWRQLPTEDAGVVVIVDEPIRKFSHATLQVSAADPYSRHVSVFAAKKYARMFAGTVCGCDEAEEWVEDAISNIEREPRKLTELFRGVELSVLLDSYNAQWIVESRRVQRKAKSASPEDKQT